MLTDIQAQRTQLLLAQAQVADTEPEIEHARRTLADIIGQPQLRADDIARLNTGNFQPPALLPAEYPAWEQRALAENPQILAAQYDVSLAKQAAEVQRGAFMPTAQIFASWSDNKSDSTNMVNQRYESLSAGVHLSVPLFRCSVVVKIWRACAVYQHSIRRRSMSGMWRCRHCCVSYHAGIRFAWAAG